LVGERSKLRSDSERDVQLMYEVWGGRQGGQVRKPKEEVQDLVTPQGKAGGSKTAARLEIAILAARKLLDALGEADYASRITSGAFRAHVQKFISLRSEAQTKGEASALQLASRWHEGLCLAQTSIGVLSGVGKCKATKRRRRLVELQRTLLPLMNFMREVGQAVSGDLQRVGCSCLFYSLVPEDKAEPDTLTKATKGLIDGGVWEALQTSEDQKDASSDFEPAMWLEALVLEGVCTHLDGVLVSAARTSASC
jgi:hypothetical protein